MQQITNLDWTAALFSQMKQMIILHVCILLIADDVACKVFKVFRKGHA